VQHILFSYILSLRLVHIKHNGTQRRRRTPKPIEKDQQHGNNYGIGLRLGLGLAIGLIPVCHSGGLLRLTLTLTLPPGMADPQNGGPVQ